MAVSDVMNGAEVVVPNLPSSSTPTRKQKLFVMRHGQRWDDANRDWVLEPGVRTWDPPLTKDGVEQARSAGEKLRRQGILISRIFVSPFVRCVQTAAGFIKGMYPESSDMSSLKVSMEYGLVELMNSGAIWYPPADPWNNEVWNLPLDKLLLQLPSGVVDFSVQPVFPKLPDWEETREDGCNRYLKTFYSVANKFPNDNILCISHGKGVMVSFTDLRPEASVNYINYCAYTEAEREVFSDESTLDHSPPFSTLSGSWKMLTELGPTSGVMIKERPVKPHTGSQNVENQNQHINGVISQNVPMQIRPNMDAFYQVGTIYKTFVVS